MPSPYRDGNGAVGGGRPGPPPPARLLLDAMDGKLTGKIGRHAIEAEFR